MRLSVVSAFIIAECLRAGIIEGGAWRDLPSKATAGDVLLQTFNISSTDAPLVSEVSTIDVLQYLNTTLDDYTVCLNGSSYQRPNYLNDTVLELAEMLDSVFPDLSLNWHDAVRCMGHPPGCWRGMWECTSDIWWRERTTPCTLRGPDYPRYDPHYSECYSDWYWRKHNCTCDKRGPLYPNPQRPKFKPCIPTFPEDAEVSESTFEPGPMEIPTSFLIPASANMSLALREFMAVGFNKTSRFGSQPPFVDDQVARIFYEAAFPDDKVASLARWRIRR